MMLRRTCKARRSDGAPCRAAPLTDSDFCAMHDPQNAEAMAEARRLGGNRRKREVTVATAFDFQGIDSVEDIKRLILVAIVDTLALESSIARSRTIGYLSQVSLKAHEVGQLQDRIAALEAAKHQHHEPHPSVFDLDPEFDDPFPGESS
jgi:hypothetical protein